MAANFVQGANTKGLNCFVKHFALNDQETQRASGLYTYCNEQALRQIYLKPFQLAVEEGKTRCIMTSFNRVGRTWSGAYKELLTNVLRGEWGFQGMCLTDYYLREDYMAEQPGIVAGNDCWLAGFEQFAGSVDLSTNTAKKYARQACHNILFAVANAKATNITVQETWLQWFVPADIAAWTLWAGWAAIVTIVLIKANKKPAEAVASKENA
jgi:beta-glucosidase